MINTPDFQSVKEDLLSLLPQPCEIRREPDNSTERYEAGDPTEVMVRLTQTDVQVFSCSYVWVSSYELIEDPQLVGMVNWRDSDAGLVYRVLIKKARAGRRRTFRKCRYCGEKFGPEHMHSNDVCQGCAELHLGVMY